jgi:hypothetical protein
VERRDRVQKAGALAGGAQLREHRAQHAQPEAFLVERYAHDLDGVVAHDAERQVVSGRLNEHHVAGRGEDREHLAEGLRVAAADEHVGRRAGAAFARRAAARDLVAQGLRAFERPVGERRRPAVVEHGGCGPAHEPDRQQRRVGLPEGELDDPFAKGVLRV